MQRQTVNADEAARAKVRLDCPDNVRHLVSEYEMLKSLKRPNMTPPRLDRYEELSLWYNQVYRKYDQIIRDAGPTGGKAERLEMGSISKAFERAPTARN
jgi:hypothetical protein